MYVPSHHPDSPQSLRKLLHFDLLKKALRAPCAGSPVEAWHMR